MRAARTAEPIRVFGGEPEVVVGRLSGPVRMAHQRRAVGPAAEQLGADILGALLQAFGLLGGVALEAVDILPQLADDQERAIAAELGAAIAGERQPVRWPGRVDVNGRHRRLVAAAVGVAEHELAWGDDVAGRGMPLEGRGAGDHRLRQAITEAERFGVAAVARLQVDAGQHADLASAGDALDHAGQRVGRFRPAAGVAGPGSVRVVMGVGQQHCVGRGVGSTPVPVRRRVAEHPGAGCRGHAVDERGREGCQIGLVQPKPTQAACRKRQHQRRTAMVMIEPSVGQIGCDPGQPGPARLRMAAELQHQASGPLQLRQRTVGERRDLVGVGRQRCPVGWRRGAEQRQPGLGLGLRLGAGEALAYAGIGADAPERQPIRRGVAEVDRPLLPVEPAGDPVAVRGALLEQQTGAREAARVGPDRGRPVRDQVDEVLHVAQPGPVVMRRKDQQVGAGQHQPASGVKGADGASHAEEAGAPAPGEAKLRQPEHAAQCEPAKPALLEPRHRDEQVDRTPVLVRHDPLDRGGAGRHVVGDVGRLRRDQRAKQKGAERPERQDRHRQRRPNRRGAAEGPRDQPTAQRNRQQRPQQRPERGSVDLGPDPGRGRRDVVQERRVDRLERPLEVTLGPNGGADPAQLLERAVGAMQQAGSDDVPGERLLALDAADAHPGDAGERHADHPVAAQRRRPVGAEIDHVGGEQAGQVGRLVAGHPRRAQNEVQGVVQACGKLRQHDRGRGVGGQLEQQEPVRQVRLGDHGIQPPPPPPPPQDFGDDDSESSSAGARAVFITEVQADGGKLEHV